MNSGNWQFLNKVIHGVVKGMRGDITTNELLVMASILQLGIMLPSVDSLLEAFWMR